MTISNKNKPQQEITADEFDLKFENGEDITPFLDFDRAMVVKRVNVDFPAWMVERLDQEAYRLNVSRQAIIKMWINDRVISSQHMSQK